MEQQPTIAVIGCGYVGLTTAALLAACGLRVYALEVNPERLAAIRHGRSFFFEAGIDKLIAEGLRTGMLIPTDSYDEAIPTANFIFSCVGTPDNADGSTNLSYVFEAARQAVGRMAPTAIYIQKSTVPVGTGNNLLAKFKRLSGGQLRYVSNPEFLREGTAILDSLWPDRIVCGGNDPHSANQVLDLYRRLESKCDTIATQAGIDAPKSLPSPRYICTGLASAELIKVSANAYLAMKISFANSMAKLADQVGADVVEVMDAVGADRRIGRAFLNAGRGYGGGCFPKDVSGLIRSAEDYGVAMELMRATTEVNESMPHYIINKAELALGRSFAGLQVGVLGLAFKAGTSDTRRSPGITIANTLARKGATVHAYDPEAIKEADGLTSEVIRAVSMADALQNSKVVFVATDWPQFNLAETLAKPDSSSSQPHLIVDCMNCIDNARLPKNIAYIGIGR